MRLLERTRLASLAHEGTDRLHGSHPSQVPGLLSGDRFYFQLVLSLALSD